MNMEIATNILLSIKKWTNTNSGFLTLLIFVTTLALGWITGLFKAILRRPNLSFVVNNGPSFCCNLPTGRKYDDNETHLTAIALYLTISNIGSAPTEVSEVQVAYHNYTLKYTFFWFWLLEHHTILNDFQVAMGEGMKIYPFLFQKSCLDGQRADTYLREGQKTTGMVYFEQPESWGGFLPRQRDGQTKLKISILDTYGNKYCEIVRVPFVSIDEARKFNPAFGKSREELRKDNNIEG